MPDSALLVHPFVSDNLVVSTILVNCQPVNCAKKNKRTGNTLKKMKLLLVVFLVHLFLGLGSAQPGPDLPTFKTPINSGCGIKDYGCYCTRSNERDYSKKCSEMFDFDLLPPFDQQPTIVRGSGGNPDMKPIQINCKQDKYCESTQKNHLIFLSNS